jgi:cytochrome c
MGRYGALWGDLGPDGDDMDGKAYTGMSEEFDLAAKPENYGYPFFAGNTRMKPGVDRASPKIPAGTDWEGNAPGLLTLPPAVEPIYPYKRSCTITGPLYRYDGDLNSSVKFPPHFDQKWLITDCGLKGDDEVSLFKPVLGVDAKGEKIIDSSQILSKIAMHIPLDVQAGPDGAIYVSNYGSTWRNKTGRNEDASIFRITYKGACRPALPKIEKPIAIDPGASRFSGRGAGPRIGIVQGAAFAVVVETPGRFTLELRDLQGRPVATKSSQGYAPVSFAEVRAAGVYFLHVRTSEGLQVLKVVRN